MLHHLIIQFSMYYLLSGSLQEVRNKRTYIFKLLAVKVVMLVYERQLFKYSDLTWKLLIVFGGETGR